MSTSRVFTVGQVFTAAQTNDLPQGILGTVSASANVGPTSGTTEMDVITLGAVTIAGTNRLVRIMFHCRGIQPTVANDIFIVRIKEGATILQEAHFISGAPSVANPFGDMHAIVAPSAASHTYKVTIQQASGTGTATVTATANGPISLIVEDAGKF